MIPKARSRGRGRGIGIHMPQDHGFQRFEGSRGFYQGGYPPTIQNNGNKYSKQPNTYTNQWVGDRAYDMEEEEKGP